MYPNPVKDIVHIEFVITEPTLIASSVYDLSGRKLFSVIDDIELGPGNYIFKKQLGNMLPGVYLHKTSFNNFPVSRVLMKE